MASIRLEHCLAFNDSFEAGLAAALEALPRGSLPLQAGCTQGGRADDSRVSVSVLDVTEAPDRVVARVGVFFIEIVGGCNCSEEPLEANAYCVLEVAIRRGDGVTAIAVLED